MEQILIYKSSFTTTANNQVASLSARGTFLKTRTQTHKNRARVRVRARQLEQKSNTLLTVTSSCFKLIGQNVCLLFI
jgi:hypothetical protein